jgi:hypothetical protein
LIAAKSAKRLVEDINAAIAAEQELPPEIEPVRSLDVSE